MRRQINITTALIFALLIWAAPAAAEEHGGGWTEPGPAEGEPAAEGGGGGHLAPGQQLPPEAINWADFTYDDESVDVNGVTVELGPPIIANVINFILLIVIIYLLARKPISAFLKNRSETVRDQLKEAQKLLEEANERLADYSSKLERMDEEMTRLREEFISAGEAEKERLIAEARTKSDRMRQDTDLRLNQEFSQLREELRIEIVEKAVAAATALLETQVKEADQRKLAEDYVERLEREGLGQ